MSLKDEDAGGSSHTLLARKNIINSFKFKLGFYIINSFKFKLGLYVSTPPV